MPTYIQKNINSDLTPFTDFNKEMSVGLGTDTSIVVSGLTSSNPQTLGFITPSGVPNSNGWEDDGTWTVELEIDIGSAQVDAKVRCVRLDVSGTILQSGAFTATQALGTSRVFSPVAPAWTDSEESFDNRLAIEIEFTTTQVMEQSISVGIGTISNEVITDITENLTLASLDINLFIVGHQTTNFRGNNLENTIFFIDDGINEIQTVPINIPDDKTAATRDDVVGLVSGLTSPVDIALDIQNEKMYWSDDGTDKIQRSNLNGSNIEDIITSASNPKGIALDTDNNKIYFIDTGSQKVNRSNLDGSNQEELIGGISGPEGIALDVPSGHMYFTGAGGTKLRRANLDGSNIIALITIDASIIIGVTLDLINRKMYWADSSQGNIKRAGMDLPSGETPGTRTDVEELVTGLTDPNWIEIDPIQKKIYWTDSGTNKIQRSNLDGSNVEDILSSGLITPLGLALITSSDILTLFTKAVGLFSGFTTLVINGPLQQTNQLDLFLANIPVVSGGLNLFTLSIDTITSGLDLLINGHKVANNNLDLIIITKDIVDDNLDLIIGSKNTSNATLDLALLSLDIVDNNLQLIINGHEKSSSDLDLVLKSKDFITSDITLIIGTMEKEDISLNLFINGQDLDESDLNLILNGHIVDSDSMTLVMPDTKDIVSSGLDLIAIGHVDDSDTLDLLVGGKDNINSNITLVIREPEDKNTVTFTLLTIGHEVINETISIFSLEQPNIALFIKGHETITSDLDFVIVEPIDSISNDLDLFTAGSGITPFSGLLLPLCINGVVAKTFDPTDPPCPPLDPLASIQISDELIGIYQSRIDALINQLGKNILLEFEKIKVPCPNCFFDTMRNRSNGIFRPGGPRPFARGRRCPWCKGNGFEESDNNKCIKALLKWNPKEAANYGLTLSDSRGVVRIKTFLTEFDDLKRAITVIANHDMGSIAKLRVKLLKGPIPVGLREDRYCISFWELIDD